MIKMFSLREAYKFTLIGVYHIQTQPRRRMIRNEVTAIYKVQNGVHQKLHFPVPTVFLEKVLVG